MCEQVGMGRAILGLKHWRYGEFVSRSERVVFIERELQVFRVET